MMRCVSVRKGFVLMSLMVGESISTSTYSSISVLWYRVFQNKSALVHENVIARDDALVGKQKSMYPTYNITMIEPIDVTEIEVMGSGRTYKRGM